MTDLSPAARHLRALIRCPSVTPEEGGALDYLVSVLEPLGFTCHRISRGPEHHRVDNLYARRGTSRPNVCFAGHTDVVPIGDADAWTAGPFKGDVRDGTMFGRGAVDMKGGVAAFLAAVERTPDHDGSISFLITGDEEGPAVDGTTAVLDWMHQRGETIDGCILGEPTNPDAMGDAIKIGRRGSLSGTLTVKGVQGHAAYPHLADNPVRSITAMLDSLMGEPLDTGTDAFEPSNLEVTSVDVGNPATNVIAARATAAFNVRFNDTWTADTLRTEIERRLAEAARDMRLRPAPRLGPEAGQPRDPASWSVEWTDRPSPVFLTRDEALIEAVSAAVERVTGRMPALSTGGGTSDARFIKDVAPVVEFGLVGQTMHQVDERVALVDLDQLADVYADILATLLNTGS